MMEPDDVVEVWRERERIARQHQQRRRFWQDVGWVLAILAVMGMIYLGYACGAKGLR